MSDNSLSKTIIKSAVAVVCTAALCVTYATSNTSKKAATVKNPGASQSSVQTVDPSTAYFSEAEAAAYIGISEEALKTIREKLTYLKGAYMTYTYYDANGKEVTSVVYNKEALDDVIEKLMNSNDKNYINLRYVQDKPEKK